MAGKAFEIAGEQTLRSVYTTGDSRWVYLRRRTYEVLARDCAHDPLSIAVDIFLVTLICISVLGIVLESIQSLYLSHRAVFDALEVFTVTVFSVEYALRLWSCVERPIDGRDAGDARASRVAYAFSPAALIDFVAVVPFYLTSFGLVSSSDFRFLRAVRLLRVLKLTRYSAAFDTLASAVRENLRALAAGLFVLVIAMLIAATGMYFFERTAQPEAFSSIPAAMWWAFATLTTVGYGDIVPVTAGGKVFGAMISVVGIGMVALPTGILASAFTEQLRRRTERYRVESDNVWRDGIVTDQEEASLEALREQLGLSRHTASQILDQERVKAILRHEPHANTCPTCGAATKS